MDLELHQLELRYEKLRRRDANKERRLVASLAENGQQLPVVVVSTGEARAYVLLDGYKRVRALESLRHDTVRAILWDLGEVEAFSRAMRLAPNTLRCSAVRCFPGRNFRILHHATASMTSQSSLRIRSKRA